MIEKWLHLGCGHRILPGAVHIDLADFPHIAFTHDFRSLPMIDASSCGGIYASHCFEYIDPSEAPIVLAEFCCALCFVHGNKGYFPCFRADLRPLETKLGESGTLLHRIHS